MAVPKPLLARRLHKWLALLVGAQLLVWTLTGLYMVSVHLDIIHGDHLIRTEVPPALSAEGLIDPLTAGRAAPAASSVRLVWLLDRPAYAVATHDGTRLVDARSGAAIPPPAEAEIREIATRRFNGVEEIVSLERLNDAPFEIRGRKGPVWRAQFEGWNKPTLYFSVETGELLTRRHELWRVFDLFFGLHIMDYGGRDNPNNLLLRIFTWSALAMALAGAWLLLYSFRRRREKAGK